MGLKNRWVNGHKGSQYGKRIVAVHWEYAFTAYSQPKSKFSHGKGDFACEASPFPLLVRQRLNSNVVLVVSE